MNPVETEKLLTATNFFYPSFLQGREPSDIAKVWSVKLKDLQFSDCLNYLDKHVEVSNFPPTIADFLQNASTDNKYLTPSKAFEIAITQAKRYGFYRSSDAMEDLKENYPLIHKTIRNMGGFSIIINNAMGLKSRFITHYELVKDSKLTEELPLKNDFEKIEVAENKEKREFNKKRFEELKLRINQNKEQSKEEPVVKRDEEIESFQAEFHDLIHC